MHGGHCISCGNEELFENYRKVQMGPTHSWKMRSYLKTQGVWENDFKNHKKCMPRRKYGSMNFIRLWKISKEEILKREYSKIKLTLGGGHAWNRWMSMQEKGPRPWEMVWESWTWNAKYEEDPSMRCKRRVALHKEFWWGPRAIILLFPLVSFFSLGNEPYPQPLGSIPYS